MNDCNPWLGIELTLGWAMALGDCAAAQRAMDEGAK